MFTQIANMPLSAAVKLGGVGVHGTSRRQTSAPPRWRTRPVSSLTNHHQTPPGVQCALASTSGRKAQKLLRPLALRQAGSGSRASTRARFKAKTTEDYASQDEPELELEEQDWWVSDREGSIDDPLVSFDLDEASTPHPERLAGAIALIVGGTVGAGIIALPVRTVAAGFLPSTVALTACWAFMVVNASLLIELAQWYGPGTNFVTMAEDTLGAPGKATTIFLYTFVYVATLTAYIAEGGKFLVSALQLVAGVAPPAWLLCTSFTAALGYCVYRGTKASDKLNSICLAVAVVAYAALVVVGVPGIQPALLARAEWPAMFSSLPIMIVAFTFHNMIPSLLPYLGCPKLLLKAVVWGSAIPLGLYTVWQAVILGTITASAHLTSSEQIIAKLAEAAGPNVMGTVQIFSLFAIVTSFLGVALGCVHFFSDLLFGARRNGLRRSIRRGVPLLLLLVPAFGVAMIAPTVFLPALEYSGTLRLILFATMPAMMVWRGRYTQPEQHQPWVVGGKATLVTVLCTAVGIIGLEVGKAAMKYKLI